MISICIATYNGSDYILEQINSIKHQISDNDEIIISDDGSTDNTISLILGLHDKRIRIHQHTNKSLVKKSSFYRVTQNFANALKHANGNYIFLSDQDDVWMPDKVKRCMEELQDYDCIVHNYTITDRNLNVQKKIAFSKPPLYSNIFLNIMSSHFRGCCMAFKREILEKSLPIPLNVIGHDYWIGNIAWHYGEVKYMMEPLILSRWYPESVSSKKKTSIWYKVSFRLVLIKELFKRICIK